VQGDILFSDTQSSRAGIYAVRAEGGKVRAIAAVDPSSEGSCLWPQFLPDGKRFLYLVGSTDGRNVVRIGSIDGGTPRLLKQESSRAAFAPPGYLLYVREGALLAQRFDVARLRLDGDPFPLVQGVEYFQPTGLAAFSVSQSGVLAYQAWSHASRLVWLDRNGRETGAVGGVAAYTYSRLAPDEKRLALAIADPRTGTEDVYIAELSRDARTRVTFAPGDEFAPVWSPDGRRIVYSWDNNAVPYLHEKILDRSGPGDAIVQPSGGVQIALDWLSDGSIIYSDISPETNEDLWILPGRGERTPRKLMTTRFRETDAALSPGSTGAAQWLAYVSDETGRPEVYVRSFPQLAEPHKVSTDGGTSPRWAHNGRELFYLEGDRLVAVPVKLQPTFEAGRPGSLFRWSPGIIDFDIAADGRFLVNSGAAGYLAAPISVMVDWTAAFKQ
jgi:Tol biopolymer transport system component